VFCTVCRWGPFADWPAPFADELLGILPVSRAEVLLPREWSISRASSLTSHDVVSPSDGAGPTCNRVSCCRRCSDRGDPADVVKEDQSTTENHLCRSDRYLDTVQERIICIPPCLSDQYGLSDGKPLNCEMGRADWQMGLINKRCRTHP
jgi:hypothetical protein